MPQVAADIQHLKKITQEIRIDIIRMLTEAGSGHPGGSLSATEIVTGLFFHKMRHRPDDPFWADRDRFILSKGHCCPVLYAALAKTGYFPKEELLTLRKLGSRLQGHPYPGRPGERLPGVETATGSLGQGLSIAIGMALAGRLAKKTYRVYALLGDGECQAGQVWEAAMLAPKAGLDHLCVIVDRNKIQNDDFVENTLSLEPFRAKWEAFGWHVIEVNGHDISQVLEALEKAEAVKGKPTVIIADTIKGKGVSFMENNPDWHGKAPNREEGERAIQEILAARL
ncbi:MAG: transketolase [candidate division NC10 bacterium]|nr:transketolase [candidate division NC10 bacterium]